MIQASPSPQTQRQADSSSLSPSTNPSTDSLCRFPYKYGRISPEFPHFSCLIILNIIIFQMLNRAIYFYNPYQNTLHTQGIPWFMLDFTTNDFERAVKENLQLRTSNDIFSKQLEEERNRRVEKSTKEVDERQCNSEQYQPQKRNYRKRRTELLKIYTCEHQACRKKYSSEMALRNHERIKHAIRRRLPPALN